MRDLLENEQRVWPRKLEWGDKQPERIKRWTQWTQTLSWQCPRRSQTVHPQALNEQTEWFLTIHCKWRVVHACVTQKTPIKFNHRVNSQNSSVRRESKFRKLSLVLCHEALVLLPFLQHFTFSSGILVNSAVRKNTQRPHAFFVQFSITAVSLRSIIYCRFLDLNFLSYVYIYFYMYVCAYCHSQDTEGSHHKYDLLKIYLLTIFIIHILYLDPIPACSPLDTSQNISHPHSCAVFFLLSPTERNVSSLMDWCCLAVLTVLVLFMGATVHYTASHSTSPHPLPLAFFPPHLPPCSGRPGDVDTMYNLWTYTTVFS